MRLVQPHETSEFLSLLLFLTDHEELDGLNASLANWMAHERGTLEEVRERTREKWAHTAYQLEDVFALFEKALNFFEQVRAQRSGTTCRN